MAMAGRAPRPPCSTSSLPSSIRWTTRSTGCRAIWAACRSGAPSRASCRPICVWGSSGARPSPPPLRRAWSWSVTAACSSGRTRSSDRSTSAVRPSHPPRQPMTQPDHTESLRLIEALLFASASPVTDAEIADRLPEGSDVAALLAELEAHYRDRGVMLAKIAGGWTFRTAPDLAPRLKLETTVQRRLSRAAVETLAIVAYHQPVTRAEIEEIRGVQISKGTIDTLMEAGWIVPKGRRETV